MSELILVKNPFDRSAREVRVLPDDAPRTVAALVGEYIPAGVEVDVSVNGHLLRRDAWAGTALAPGDQMVAVPRVCGDGFNPLAAILSIAVIVAAPYAAAALMGTTVAAATGGIGFTLLSAGIAMTGSMIVGALTAPAKPTLPGASSFDASPAYSWTPATTQEPGGPIVRAYGRVKLHGNVIGGYIENTGDSGKQQIAHLLIDLGMGPYARTWDHKINDQPVSSYNGVELVERLGQLAQSVIPAFNDTRDTYVIGAKVVAGAPVTRDTVGTDFGALEIVLTLPQGLWYANDQGGLDAYAADLKVEVSTDGGASWKVAATSEATSTVTSAGYWSAGYYSDAGGPVEEGLHLVWTQVEAGSTTRTDHTEGEAHAPVSGYAMRVYWRWIAEPVTRTLTTNDHLQLSAASTQPIRKTIRVDGITPGTACKVRVTNLTADQTSSRYGDDVYFAELNEVILDDFTYPRAVLVAVKALATDQLSGSMRFSCLTDAALIWTKFGGTWSYGWSNSPAWVCWDILTQPVTNDAGTAVLRYDGLDPSRLDVDSFVAWAAFCAISVSDGKGGSEARCEFDGIFDSATDMWSAALEVAATARATLIMRGTQIAAVYDDVRSAPAQVFTVANSSDFSETFLPMEGRASVIEAEFNNRELDYGRDRASVINDAVAAASGVSPPASKAFRGVVRASQVWRELNTMLARNQYLQRTGTLAVDIDSLAATAGDRVDLQVDVTLWGEGGRALAGSASQVTLDHPVTLAAGVNEITVRLSDPASDAIETRTITTGAGTVSVVDVTPAFSYAVRQYDVWAIGAVGQSTKPFLITGIARDSERRAKLSLIEYNASLYGLDDGIPAQQTPNISASVGFGSVIDLTVSEQQIPALDGTSQTQVTLHFGFDERSRVRAVLAYAQPVGAGAGTQTARTTGDAVQFILVDGVSYLFTLVTQNFLGQWQPFAAGASTSYGVVGRGATVQAPGAAGAPNAPTSLIAAPELFAIGLTWSADAGTRRDIRHTEVWASNTNDRAAAARVTCAPWPELKYKHIGLSPGQQWYYWVRLQDTSANWSAWYPAGAAAGVPGKPSTDASALLAQLQDAVGMAQLAAELAAPIEQVQPIAEVALRLLLKADEAKQRAITEKWISDATIELDKAAGTVTLLATAEVSTDIEAHLRQVDLTLGAQDGTIIAHTASLSNHDGRITVAEDDITLLEGSVSLKASTSYVDSTVATALGALDPSAQEAFQNTNAIGLLHSLLDTDAGRKLAQSSVARLASAERTLSTHADAISAEATERLILAAMVEGNLAAIVSEASARATADSAEASARTTLAATVAANTAAISTEASTRASADSANASSISTVQARLDSGDFAAVKVESSANASAIGGVEAKWGVQVQTMADGTRALAGITLLAGTDGESVFAMLADKLLVYKPDGSGAPKQIVTLGTVNGVTALGLLGDLIVDGTIVTRTIAANNITVPVAAHSSGQIITHSTLTSILSVSITTSGGPVLIIGATAVYSSTASGDAELTLHRDGGSPITWVDGYVLNNHIVPLPIMHLETPPAGTHTYELKVYSPGDGSVGQVNLSATELKR